MLPPTLTDAITRVRRPSVGLIAESRSDPAEETKMVLDSVSMTWSHPEKIEPTMENHVSADSMHHHFLPIGPNEEPKSLESACKLREISRSIVHYC